MGKTLALVLGLLIVLVWGTSFVCSKNLVNYGLLPHEVYLLRAIISYFTLLTFSHKRFFSDSKRDEFCLFLLGVFGGSLYYVLENTALATSYATNVSFIVSLSPLMTAIIMAVFFKMRLGRRLLFGAFLAIVGLFLLVFNGTFSYSMHLVGDVLAVAAALSWAVYSVLIKGVSSKYDVFFITRKVFFYGVLTVAPYFLFKPFSFPLEGLCQFGVLSNLLYLALLSSMLAFIIWIYVIEKLGPVNAANLVYLSPVFTFLFSSFCLNEPVNVYSVCGAILILFGVYYSENLKER